MNVHLELSFFYLVAIIHLMVASCQALDGNDDETPVMFKKSRRKKNDLELLTDYSDLMAFGFNPFYPEHPFQGLNKNRRRPPGFTNPPPRERREREKFDAPVIPKLKIKHEEPEERKPASRRKTPLESSSDSNLYKSEYSYTAPRRARYNLKRQPDKKRSFDENYRPSTSSYDFDDRSPPGPIPTSSSSYAPPSPPFRRKAVKEGKTRRYNVQFHDGSDGGFDGGESSEDKLSDPPMSFSYKSKLSHSKPPKYHSDYPMPDPEVRDPRPSGSRHKLKEGETFVEGYEWRGEPEAIKGRGPPSFAAPDVREEESREKPREDTSEAPRGKYSYSYTATSREEPSRDEHTRDGPSREEMSRASDATEESEESDDQDSEKALLESKSRYAIKAGKKEPRDSIERRFHSP